MAGASFLVVTTMKNEGAFMLEWIAYNRSIGFTDFLIFTNDCDDGTDEISERLQALDLATHIANPVEANVSPQRQALRRAWKHPKVKAADWLICADCDEFLNIRVGQGHLTDLVSAIDDADAISMCWKLFGNSGRISYENGFVTEQFLFSAPEDRFPNYRAKGLKTLFRNKAKFRKFGVHRPRTLDDSPPLIWIDGGGVPMPPAFLEKGWSAPKGFSHDFARLHHYAVRSVDSFLVKRDRGRTNHYDMDQGLDYWQHMNTNHEEDRTILNRLPSARQEYNNLLSDPELNRLHAAACQWHKDKIASLNNREDWRKFRKIISSETGKLPALAKAEHADH